MKVMLGLVKITWAKMTDGNFIEERGKVKEFWSISVTKFGIGSSFRVAVSCKFKAFNWGWFRKSTVLVGQAVPNKSMHANC